MIYKLIEIKLPFFGLNWEISIFKKEKSGIWIPQIGFYAIFLYNFMVSWQQKKLFA